MDPISLAIVAAISAGLSSGVGRVSQDAVVDAYGSLKAVLKRKFGYKSTIIESVEALELKPSSAARKHVVEEEIQESRACDDAEIVDAARILLELLKESLENKPSNQLAIGSYIAQADRGGHAEVKVNSEAD